eukprot:4615967-Prorocentrum_lima.AAC.1
MERYCSHAQTREQHAKLEHIFQALADDNALVDRVHTLMMSGVFKEAMYKDQGPERYFRSACRFVDLSKSNMEDIL